MHKRALTLVELLIVSCLIFILIGMFAGYAGVVLRVGRDIALRNELTNIRMAILHYEIINSNTPKSLKDLTKEYLTYQKEGVKIKKNKFLISCRQDKDGNLLDPYLNKYSYDASRGLVWSLTRGGW